MNKHLFRLERRGTRWLLGAVASAALLATATAGYQFGTALDAQPVAYVAPVEFNNWNIASGKSVVYRGDYIRGSWDGDLVAEALGADGSLDYVKWRARLQLLPTSTSWNTERKIFTRSSANNVGGIPFRWASLTANQQAYLSRTTGEGQKMLNYIRGDASNELTETNTAGTYRARYSKLGAIVHSRPYFYDHGTAAAPIPRVYVGANDGMLHAFDADTGKEVFAYVPSMLFGTSNDASKLRDLTTVNPTFKYYVDAPLTIGKIPGTGSTSTTLLVGGLGAGGIGLFALDLTNPTPAAEDTAAATALAKWEITDINQYSKDLGHVYGPTPIVKLNDGRTVVLAPNGINSEDGKSSLYVIDPSDGKRLAQITAGNGGNNGLGAIAAVDLDGNGTVDAVYAGDYKGSLWKFDLSTTTLPLTATELYKPSKLMPITAAPSVMVHPLGGVMVNFATGSSFDNTDLVNVTDQYLYGIWDSSTKGSSNAVIDQTLSTITTGSGSTRVSSSNAVGYVANSTSSSSPKGWRITLAGGERVLGADTLTDSGRYVVTTTSPNASNSPDDLLTMGRSWLLQIDALTGGNPVNPFFDLNGDGTVDKRTGSEDRVQDTGRTGSPFVAPVGQYLGMGVWSQPVLAQLNSSFDIPYFNSNDNLSVPATTVTTSTATTLAVDTSVKGGHFDYDIYWGTCTVGTGYRCSSNTHTHQYDDKWNVLGASMISASNPVYNLDKPMTSTTTPRFKLLVANVNFSPGVKLSITGTSTSAGGSPKAVTLDKVSVWALPVSQDGFLSDVAGGAALTFSRGELTKFTWELPTSGFSSINWGTGDVRSGLHPSVTGCVRGNSGGGVGQSGPWMNGSLVFQFVKESTPGSAVAPQVAKDPTGIEAGGYALKKDTASQANQIVQYTVFRHAGACYGTPGWSKTPALDRSTNNRPVTRPASSQDPVYTAPAPSSSGTPPASNQSITTTVATYLGKEVTVVRDFTDAGLKQTIIYKSNGLVADTSFSGTGSTNQASLQQGLRAKTGRLAWKELLR